MKVGVAKETAPGEQRVALVPEALGKLQAAECEILVEAGAGDGAAIPDGAYTEAGATIVATDALYAQSDAILKVAKPNADEVGRLRDGSWLRY
jgi:NAD(P) transhydrogenase subunit alpha